MAMDGVYTSRRFEPMGIVGKRGRPRLRSVSMPEKPKLLNIFHKSIHRTTGDPRFFAAESDANREGVFVKSAVRFAGFGLRSC